MIRIIFYTLSFIFSFISFCTTAQVALNLHVLIEGYYTGNGLMDNYGSGGCLYVCGISTNLNDADTLTVSLSDPTNLAIVESQRGILQTNGTIVLNFTQVNSGSSYFIKINHRNALETWSAQPVIMQQSTSYDFTTADSMASCRNMTESFDHHGWMIYSGDISDANQSGLGLCFQDRIIEGQDYLDMLNALPFHIHGYSCAEITGDGNIDTRDSLIMNNAVLAIRFACEPAPIGIKELNFYRKSSNKNICVVIDGRMTSKTMFDPDKKYRVKNINGQICLENNKLFANDNSIELPDGIYVLTEIN